MEKTQQIKQTKAAYQRIFGQSDDGKRILEDLAKHCGMNHPGYFPDSDKTVFMAGNRSVYLYIQNMISDAVELPEKQEEK